MGVRGTPLKVSIAIRGCVGWALVRGSKLASLVGEKTLEKH